jgi:membrane protein required for colicin V production
MGDLHLNAFDLAAIAIILISSIMAFARGLLREVFSIVAFIGAAAAAYYGYAFVAPMLSAIGPPTIAKLAAAILLFIVAFVIITVLTSTLAKAAHKSGEIGALDRGAGLLFGAARGVLVLALFVLLMRHITGAPQAPMPNWLADARTYPVLESAAEGIESFVPQARDYIKEKRAAESGSPAPVAPAESSTEPASAPSP